MAVEGASGAMARRRRRLDTEAEECLSLWNSHPLVFT